MRNLLKYVITVAVGLVMSVLVLCNGEIFHTDNPYFIYRDLADAFTIPGVVLTGVGLLVFCTNEGVFDGLNYAVKSFFNMFRRNAPKYNSLYDYREAKGREKLTFGFVVFSGLGFLAVAIVFYLIWLQYV